MKGNRPDKAERGRDRMKREAVRVAAAEVAAARQRHALGVTLDRAATCTATQAVVALPDGQGSSTASIESTETELWTRLFLHNRSGDALRRLWGIDDATVTALTAAPLALEDLEDDTGRSSAAVVQKRLSWPAFCSGLHRFELFLGVFWGS